MILASNKSAALSAPLRHLNIFNADFQLSSEQKMEKVKIVIMQKMMEQNILGSLPLWTCNLVETSLIFPQEKQNPI